MPKANRFSDEIIFMTFKIYQDSTSISKIELLEKKSISGTLKGTQTSVHAENRLIIKQEDVQHQVVNEMSIEHPLFRYVEYGNQVGELETRLVEQKSAEFFIRVALHPKTYYIRIDEIRNDEKRTSTAMKIR
ncbi:MAG: hypothetical protein JNM57_06620 [Cyclobacteriaceae bacterium]|nr:hypothetical protein [Cyclobacteriaceae bacterium]